MLMMSKQLAGAEARTDPSEKPLLFLCCTFPVGCNWVTLSASDKADQSAQALLQGAYRGCTCVQLQPEVHQGQTWSCSVLVNALMKGCKAVDKQPRNAHIGSCTHLRPACWLAICLELFKLLGILGLPGGSEPLVG
jgi:hypothetical protein